MEKFLSPWLVENNPFLFIVQLIWLSIFLSGHYFVYTKLIKSSTLSSTEKFTEAYLFLPYFLFPLLFFTAYFGYAKYGFITYQIFFTTAGVIFTVKNLKSTLGLKRFFNLNIPFLCASIYCVFFLYWSWLMPYPHKWNAHHFFEVNLIQNMWHTGQYKLIPCEFITYDNNMLVWSAHFPIVLSTFSLYWFPAIEIRTIFLLPPLSCILTLLLLRKLSLIHTDKEIYGYVAFLLIAGGYFITSSFYQINFDLLSPVILLYFLVVLSRKLTFSNYGDVWKICVLIGLAYLVRKHLLPIIIFSSLFFYIYLFVVNFKKYNYKINFEKIRTLIIIFLVSLPTLIWASVVFIKYKDPFYPYSNSITNKIFKSDYNKFYNTVVSKYLKGLKYNNDVIKEEEKLLPSSQNYLLNKFIEIYYKHFYFFRYFFPIYSEHGFFGYLKNIFCGIGVSVVVILFSLVFIFIGSTYLIRKKRYEFSNLFLVITSCFLGYIISLVISFTIIPFYPKYSHYFAYILTLPAAIILTNILRKLKLLNIFCICLVFLHFLSWAGKNFGYREKLDRTFESIKFLNPSYRNVFARIAHHADTDEETIRKGVQELVDAYSTNKRILHLDIEPGGLLPCLLNKEFLAEAIYLDNKRAKDIIFATNYKSLKMAFEKLNIGYVFLPGRYHGEYEKIFLMKLLRKYKGSNKYVVPVEDLLKISIKNQ